MKTITLNIGLETNDGGRVKLHDVILNLADNRFFILESRLDVSASGENTLVAVVTAHFAPEWTSNLFRLARSLNQDCIATSDGELIGPNAEKWKPFNPDFFVHFDESENAKDIEIEIEKLKKELKFAHEVSAYFENLATERKNQLENL